MEDLGWSVRPQGEPVADAVGNHEGAISPPVKAGPVPKEPGPEPDIFAEHDLPPVGMPGERQGKIRSEVECVRMMRQQNGKGFRRASWKEFAQRLLNGAVAVSSGASPPTAASPAQPENLQTFSAGNQLRGFVHKQRHIRGARLSDKCGTIFNQIMIPDTGENSGSRLQPVDQIDRHRKIAQSEINDIPGDQNEVRREVVGRVDNAFKNPATREPADMEVAEVGDG